MLVVTAAGAYKHTPACRAVAASEHDYPDVAGYVSDVGSAAHIQSCSFPSS